MLSTLAIVLCLKIYLILFVMDFALGLYSFFSSFVLFNVLFFAYTKYKDPYVKVMEDKEKDNEKEKTTGRSSSAPLISIVVPVKNEEDNIRNCVESCLNQTYENKEVIIVNDGSTDKTAAILDEIRKEVGVGGGGGGIVVGGSGVVVGTVPALASTRTSSNPFSTSSTTASSTTPSSSNITNNNIINKPKFHILHLSRSVGKKQAVEAASQIAKGEIYAFMDSDCDMAIDAVEKAAQVFISDKQLGALTSHGRVRGAHTGNILQKMQDVYIDGSCRAIKAMETTFSSVTCCSGSLSFYRRAAIQHFIHDWAHDRFLGMDFKFCTDRRMTAYVLGTKPTLVRDKDEGEKGGEGEVEGGEKVRANNNNSNNSTSTSTSATAFASPILQTGNDDLNTLKSTSDPDIDDTKAPQHYWNVKYSQNIRVNVGVPTTLMALLKQQIRWKKSFIRSLSSTGGMYWRRPFYPALLYYIQTAMKFLRPYILFHALFILPFEGDIRSTILWLLGVLFTGMIYSVDFRLRNPGDRLWIYRPVFTFITTFLYTWLLPYAAATIRNKGWR
jgi:hyaluronan synthase